MQKQRYLVTYKSQKPNEPTEITFSVFAKRYNQAINFTRVFINAQGLHNSIDHGYDLTAAPSNKAAQYDIPDEEESVEDYNYEKY